MVNIHKKLTLVAVAALVIGGGFAVWKWAQLDMKKSKTTQAPIEIEGKPKSFSEDPTSKQLPKPFQPFAAAKVAPDFSLNGAGTNIDSPEFFEAVDPESTLLLVSAKGNDMVEVWKFPFQNNQLPPLKRDSLPNGLDVDQDEKLFLIGDSQKRLVEIRTLPELTLFSMVGKGALGSGETNLDTLTLADGSKHIYVSENKKINVFDLKTGAHVLSFSPNVDSIEEVLADSFHQIIYVPDEGGIESKIHEGGAVTVYHPDGEAYLKNNSNIFGQGVFTGDEEGITLRACKGSDGKDDGSGVIIVANQASKDRNSFGLMENM